MTEERESQMEPITLHCLAPSSLELSPANRLEAEDLPRIQPVPPRPHRSHPPAPNAQTSSWPPSSPPMAQV